MPPGRPGRGWGMTSIFGRVILAVSILAAATCRAGEDCDDYSRYLHWVGSHPASAEAVDVAVRGNYAFLSQGGLKVVDISDPANPVAAATLPITGSPQGLERDGDLLYLALYSGGLAIVDISVPTAPVLVSSFPVAGQGVDVAVDHGIALMTRYRAATVVLDVSAPGAPVVVSELPSTSRTMGVGFAGALAAICDEAGKVTFWDLGRPAEPLRLGTVVVNTSEAFDVLVDGAFAYVAAGTAGLVAIDATQPQAPLVASRFDTPSLACSLELEDGVLYLADASGSSGANISGVFTFDLADPRSPAMIGHRAAMDTASQVGVDEGRVCVTSRHGPGMLVYDASSPRTEPRQAGPMFTPWTYLQVTHQGDRAWVAGAGNGPKYIVDTTDAAHPVVAYAFPSTFGYNTIWGDVVLAGDLAFVAESDLNPTGPDTYVAAYRDAGSGAPVLVARTPVGPGIRGLAGDGDRLVALAYQNLLVLDVTDAGVPVVRGTLALGDWGNDVAISGRSALVVAGRQLRVIDISDPAAPVERSRLEMGTTATQVVPRGDAAVVCLDFQGLRFVDLADPSAPRVVASFDPVMRTTRAACDGDVLYTYCAGAGGALYDLSIVAYDIADPTAPRMLGSIGEYGITGMALGAGHVFYCQETGSRAEFVVAPVQCREPKPLEVAIDIKPGSDANPVPCDGRGRGVIPVAILTTATFDAATVDHATVRFGPAGAAEAHANRRGPIRHLEDVDGDGDRDLVFHFRQEETGIRCGDTAALLTGMTYDGRKVEGTDLIQTKGSGGGAPAGEPVVAVTPNPFNPQTRVSFAIARQGRVRVVVHDVRGRHVATLADQAFAAGEHAVTWPGCDAAGQPAPSGVYFFRVETDEGARTVRAMLLK